MVTVPIYPEAAVALVHATSAGGSVLLIRRAADARDPWSGHWALPGGRREGADEDPLETALRETREECGVDLDVGSLSERLPLRRAGPPEQGVTVAPFVFTVPSPLPTRPASAEVDEARWVPLDLLRDPGRHAKRTIPGQPADRLYPSIALGAVPLWGFTYRLLCDWLGLPTGG